MKGNYYEGVKERRGRGRETVRWLREVEREKSIRVMKEISVGRLTD